MKSALLTPETTFDYIPSIGDNLLAVRAGAPLVLTAERSGCIVDAAVETVRRVACSISTEDGSHLLWSAVYSLTMAHGLIESIQAALEDLEPSKGFSYYIAPADHTAPGPFTWFVVNDNERVIKYGTADTWNDADQIACDTIERLEQEPEPAPEPAKPDPADDPEVMRRTWTDLAEMAAGQLAKLDANSLNPSHYYTAEPVSDGGWLWRLFDSVTGAVVLYGLEASEDACHEAANKSAEQVGCTLLNAGASKEGAQ